MIHHIQGRVLPAALRNHQITHYIWWSKKATLIGVIIRKRLINRDDLMERRWANESIPKDKRARINQLRADDCLESKISSHRFGTWLYHPSYRDLFTSAAIVMIAIICWVLLKFQSLLKLSIIPQTLGVLLIFCPPLAFLTAALSDPGIYNPWECTEARSR